MRKSLEQIIAETLGKQFKGRIHDVRIRRDTDSDGEPVLRIYVTFAEGPSALNARKLSGAVRRLRPRLEEINEKAFPLLNFISEADARPQRAAR
jgi:hypothetical protein